MQRIPFTKDDSPADYHLIIAYLQQLPRGEYSVTIVRKRKTRTNPQNAYLWGIVYAGVLFGLRDAGWEITDTEQVHEWCKQKFAAREVINRDTGEVLSLPRSTVAMNTAEFQTYVDQIRAFALEYLNVQIPAPNE